MPRPRTTSDADILDAAYRVITRLGPANMTLADVAGEVGLSAATLVQRFGSKRGLLLALCKLGLESVDECFASLRTAHASPLAALIAAATEMTRHVSSPEELANGLAFLQMDVSDPEFRKIALENSNRILAGYRALIADAIAANELIACDEKKLALTVGAVVGGSLIAWAIHRHGTAESWVHADLATLLEPYRTKSLRKNSSKKRTPKMTGRMRES